MLQVNRRTHGHGAKQTQRQIGAEFTKVSQQQVSAERKTGERNRRSGTQSLDHADGCRKVFYTSGVIWVFCETSARATAAMIHAKRSHAALLKSGRQTDHVATAMRAAQTVEHQNHMIAASPFLRAVVVHDEHVAIIQSKSALDSRGKLNQPREERCPSRLCMRTE